MATLVSFHAHPDDEAIPTGGTLAKAASEGHRVVLVFGTRGEHGEVEDGFLDAGETLAERRVQETLRSAQILGAARVEFLGYVDSGMMGTPQNEEPASFWQADLEEAAARLASILAQEEADVLTVYDDHGVYGHPDHIQVHRVGVRAAELAGTRRVYESTGNRDAILAGMLEARAMGVELPGDLDPNAFADFGVTDAEITTVVDVTDYLDVKRASMRAHASQIADTSFFLAIPEEFFARAFGQEWYIRRDRQPERRETSLFEGLE
ncbi:MAG: PIG-L family deacetylase [Acidimicrobiia bacterium]|nr:PIG-L family deacetylase [Acidimicrobiia bacterium]